MLLLNLFYTFLLSLQIYKTIRYIRHFYEKNNQFVKNFAD